MRERKNHIGRAILCGVVLFVLGVALSSLLLKLQGKPTYLDRIPELVHTYLEREDTDKGTLTVFVSPQELAEKNIPHFETRWMLQNLSDDDLRNFVSLYRYAHSAIFQGESREWVMLPIPTNYDKVQKLIEILRSECPELVTLNRKENLVWHYKDSNGLISVSFPALDAGKTMYDECRAVIDSFLSQTAGMTDAEKERYVYDALTNSTTYDLDSQWAGSAYGALVLRRAKCDGISAAFQWVMEEMGIPCLTITGRPMEGEGHAWNLLLLDNAWYTVDLTADMLREEETAPHQNSYYVYNASMKWAKRDFVLDDFGVPLPEAETMLSSWHVQNGSFLRSQEEAVERLNQKLPALLRGEAGAENRILFQFQKSADMTIFQSELESLINEIVSRTDSTLPISGAYHISTMEEYHTMALMFEMEE